jgi:hypothetical protein
MGRRKVRPVPFIPTVEGICARDVSGIRGLEATISYWTEGAYSAEEWFAEVSASWGPPGLVMRRGEEVLGFAVYGPPGYLSRAGRYPVGPLGEDTALLAHLRGDTRTRRHLLVRVMRDLRLSGVSGVEAIASDLGLPRHVSTRFFSESGWKPVRRGWHAGLPYTLMRAHFGSTVEVGERTGEFVGKVKLPVLKVPTPDAPAPAQASAHERAGAYDLRGALAKVRTRARRS